MQIKLLETITDAFNCIEMLSFFLRETSYKQGYQAAMDREHLGKLVYKTRQFGYVWIAYSEDEPLGLLMAIKEPNMWIPSQKELREIVWYVRPEYRKSTIGGRLFKKYCEKGEELLKSGEIQGFFTTKMTTTDEVNLERRGFRLTEQTYLKE